MLAASALNLMVPFLRNSVAKAPDTFKIEPTDIIELPSVLTYTFVPVTGAIIFFFLKEEDRDRDRDRYRDREI
jgi:hypothetical protein